MIGNLKPAARLESNLALLQLYVYRRADKTVEMCFSTQKKGLCKVDIHF